MHKVLNKQKKEISGLNSKLLTLEATNKELLTKI